MNIKYKHTSFNLLVTFLFIVAYASTLQAQTGPAGVGNSDGTNGQPKNETWFDASSLNLANGADVSLWPDLSGNSNNATQDVVNSMPIYTTNAINNHSIIRFRPVNTRKKTCLYFDGTFLVNTEYSLFSVAARRDNGNNFIFRGGVSQNNKCIQWGWRASTDGTFAISHHGAGSTELNSPVTYSINTFYAMSSILSSNSVESFENSKSIGKDNTTSLLSANDGVAIGRHWDTQTQWAAIDVAEIIIYSDALNQAQRIIVDNYLSAKYATPMAENDHYSHTTYTNDVIGIGATDGENKHLQTSGSGGGLLLSSTNESLNETNEFVFAGHNGASATASTSDLPTFSSGNILKRSNRDWYIDRTEEKDTKIKIGFNLSEIGLASSSSDKAYILLYRNGTTGTYTAIEESQGTNSNGIVWMPVSNENLKDGYYTIGETDLTGNTWYSYRSGNWDDWLTWTLEESGGDLINPNKLTPSTSPTALIDKVVIVSPFVVTVSTNNKSNAELDIKTGTIDLGTTSNHMFNRINGQGRIRINGDIFPEGDATNFSSQGGGTVVFYGLDYSLVTPRTFNNVEVDLANSADVITLLSDYTLNGSFTINKGVFQINDNTSSTILKMDIAGDVTVNHEGKITVGNANTIGSYSLSSPSTLPPVGMYHKIYHQILIGGNLLNNGSIRLTNQAAPAYSSLTTTGAATLIFNRPTDKTATLNGTTDLYNLIVDKGIDKTFILTINASNANYFRLFGANAAGRVTGNEFTEANPEIRKALWIKNGTLELTGSIVIPSLTEGRINGTDGNGDFAIPANGRLWINGNDVEVYSTARLDPWSPQLMEGTTGVDAFNAHDAISIYGEFKITKGYFNTRNSAGMIFFPEYSAVVTIEGGLCDIAQFRSSTANEAVGATAFVMSGGEIFIRGATSFNWDTDFKTGYRVNPDQKSGDPNDITYTYPSFGILNPDGVFQMTGGTIYVADVTSQLGNNIYKNNGILINTKAENHNASGGKIHILLKGDKFDISSSNPLPNLEITQRIGNSGEVHMLSDLTINGNLTLNKNAILYAQKYRTGSSKPYKLPVCNLTVTGSFIMNDASKYYPLNNTTTLYVTGSNILLMNGISNNQEFFNLTIKKNPNQTASRLTLSGNTSKVTIHNNLTIEPGAVFRHSNKNIIVKGNIYNSGTIELASPANTSKVQLTQRGIVSGAIITAGGSYTSIPTITISAPPSGGVTATAIPIFTDSPQGNALPLAGISITNSGSGYITPPTITISGGGGAVATAIINTKHELGGNGNGTFGNLEVNEVHPAETGGKKEITYLSANQKVSNIFTLTNGILDLGPHNLDVYKLSTYGQTNEENSYSETKLLRTASNFSDGGLTLSIFGNGTYLFPIGTYNSTSKTNRFAWAKPVISNFTDNGKLQINGVNQKLPTLAGSTLLFKYLNYYWRVRFSEFTSLPNVTHKFKAYNIDRLSNFDLFPNWSNMVVGKVVNNIRYGEDPEIGALQYSNANVINYLNYDPTVLETGEFTCGSSFLFYGEIEVFYTRNLGDAYALKWDSRDSWTSNQTGGFRTDLSPHDSRQPRCANYPGPGDIAVIGWVPWDDTNTNHGKPHGVCIDNISVDVAKVIFYQMTDAAGNPVPRNYYSSFQFRPTICINETGQLNSDMIEGEGMFWNRWSDPDFGDCDMGDFVANDSSFMVYENNINNRTYNNIPTTVPNIIFSNNDWGRFDYNVTLSKDLKATGNVQLLGEMNLLLSGGTAGDIEVGRDLIMYSSEGIIGGSSYGGAILRYPNSANARTVTVHGNIILNNSKGKIEIIGTGNPTTNHLLNLYGNIYQNTTNNGGLQLNVGNGNHITLQLLGEGVNNHTIASGAIPNFYRIVMDKGNSRSSSFTFNCDLNLNGPTNGSTKNTKALELNNGNFIMNHKDIDITLSSGGSDFEIPATTGLTIMQGTARITAPGSNGILLDGLLDIQGVGANQGALILDGGEGSNNYIQYSSSGNAEIRVQSGKLFVGSQIRSTTENNLGVLKYMQTGKTGATTISEVTVGARSAPTNSRGVFEVFNPGSRFFMLNGSLNIARAHDVMDTETRAALYLTPDNNSINKATTINIGENTNGGTITMNSAVDLGIVNVRGNSTAKLHVRNLGVIGNLTINEGSAFDGSRLNLTLSSNLINGGIKNINVDSLYFIGNEQIIDGDIEVENMYVQPTASVTLTGNTDTITVNTQLAIDKGVLADNGRIVEIKGNLRNESTHTTTGNGHLLFNGTSKQYINGSGDFGAIKLDNTSGLELNSNISLNNNLIMSRGNIILKDNLLSLSINSIIDDMGSSFNANKMIQSNGNIGDAGVIKHLSAGAFNFVFPVGIHDGVYPKYTPIEFNFTANSSIGSIQLHPINQQHMTTISLGSNMLQYYWIVESSGLSNLSGNAKFHYSNDDINGDETQYIAARLLDDAWAKFPHDGSIFDDENYMRIDYTGQSSITGEYTAGYDDNIPAVIPVFISNGNGVWTDTEKWICANGFEVPEGGPQGHIVRIREQDTIKMDRYRILCYKTQIYGCLKTDTIGHNFGKVSGNGKLVYYKDKIFPGEYTEFLACGTGGTVEFSGDSYTIPTFNQYSTVDDQYNHLIISGTGTKFFPDRDKITICGNLSIIGNTTLKMEHWGRPNTTSKLTYVKGNILIGNSATWDMDYGEFLYLYGNFDIQSGGKLNASPYSYQRFYWRGAIRQYSSGKFTDENSFSQIQTWNFEWQLNSPVEIDYLVFYNGTIFSDSDRLLTITRSNGSGLKYSTDYSGIVEGPIKINMRNTTSYPFFPVGKNGVKKFININSLPSTVSYYTGEYFGATTLSGGMDPEQMELPLKTISKVEYWSISSDAGSSVGFSLPITAGNDVCQTINDIRKLRIAVWNGSKWEEIPSAPSAGATRTSGTINTTTKFAFTAGQAYYFTIATAEDIIIPTAQFTSADTIICQGESVTLRMAFTGSESSTKWHIEYSANGSSPTTVNNLDNTNNSITVTPTATTTYEITAVGDNVYTGTPSGTAIGGSVTVTVQPTPNTFNVSASASTICGIQTVNIKLSGSQRYYTYELYRDGFSTGATISGNNYPISFSGIALAGTYTIYAYRTGYPQCKTQMLGSSIITLSSGASAIITGFTMNDSICDGNPVQIDIRLNGVGPFNFTLKEAYTGNSTDVENITASSGTTYTYTVNPSPTWVNQSILGQPSYVAKYTYSITNVSDNSGCGAGSGSGEATLTVFKIPETGEQYHIPNGH